MARLIREAANEANDPVYGKLAVRYDRPPAPSVRTPDRRSASVATVAVGESQPRQPPAGSNSFRQQPKSCPMCAEGHTLFACRQFKSLSVEDHVLLAKQNKLCFNCLTPNHLSSSCPLDRRCTVNGCGKRHTKFLHVVVTPDRALTQRSEQSVENMPQVSSVSGVTSVTTGVTGAGTSRNALPIVPLIVRNPESMDELQIYALIDSGSTNSFCSSEVMQQLNLHAKRETLNLTTLDSERKVIDTALVSLELCSLDRAVVLEIPEVFVTERVPIKVENKADSGDIKAWPHLADIQLPEVDTSKVSLLIGQNCPDAAVPLEIRSGESGSPYAVRTIFGWVVNGPVGRLPGERRTACVNFVQSTSLENRIEGLWTMDVVPEPTDEYLSPLSVNDRKTLEIWNESIWQCNGHYEVAIPFKNRPPNLPDNLSSVTQRLQNLRRKLLRDPSLHEKYTAYMNELLLKGYAEKAVNTPDTGHVWYLPHHSVSNVNKPGKVRIVFDCSAKCGGTSLNDNVFQGPDLMNKLIGVLLRFREGPVALMADVEAMFHQVHVSVDDRDFLRFLWWPNGDLHVEPETYRMTVHLFGGIWCPSCCSYVMRHGAEERRMAYDEKVINTVLRNFYVDDCLKSVASEGEAVRLIRDLRALLHECGFNLTKWTSNKDDVDLCRNYIDRKALLSASRKPMFVLKELWESDGSRRVISLALRVSTKTSRCLAEVFSVSSIQCMTLWA